MEYLRERIASHSHTKKEERRAYELIHDVLFVVRRVHHG